MGSWNSTCALSNLPIKRGDKVVFLALTENIVSYLSTGISSLWAPTSLPIYAKYDDFGSIEKWSKSEEPLLDMALNYFKRSLVGPCTVRMNDGRDVKVEKETLTVEQMLVALCEEKIAKVTLFGHGKAKCVAVLIRRDVWNSLLKMEVADFLGRRQSLALLKAGIPALLEDTRNRAASVTPEGFPLILLRDTYETDACPLRRSVSNRGEDISPQCEMRMDLRAALTNYGQKQNTSNLKLVELLLARHIELTTIGYVMDATRRCWQPTSAVSTDPNFKVHRAFQARVAKLTVELERKWYGE